MFEYVDGPRDCKYLFYKEQLYTKGNNDYWKCKNNECNALVRMVDDQIVKEAKHPMHGEVSTVEIECLKIIKKMKVDAATDLNVDLKVIYDRSIKLLTEKRIRLVDLAVYIKPYPSFRSTLNKCREKKKPNIPKTIDDVEITGDYRLTNEHLLFLSYDNNN